MNKKFLPGAVLFIIAFVLSNLASLAQVKAIGNTFYGEDAGVHITTGDGDSGFGYIALYDNTSGSDNTACGSAALQVNTSGNNNTATGSFALYNNTTGNNNTASGFHALDLQYHRQLQHGQRLSGALPTTP